MVFSKIMTVLIISAALLLGCSTDKSSDEYCSDFKKTKDGKPIVRLQQQWFANSGFAGEVIAQYRTSSKYGIAIDVIPGSDQIDTKQVVKLGDAEVGVAGAEQIMQANEKGAGFVIIGVINSRSLACFISKKEKGIIKPKDMEGYRIGTMEGSPVDLIYQALKEKEELAISKADEVPTGWVLTGFVQDEYDVYPAFINDEPITLQLQGIDVNTILPSHYGVDFIGTVYFCRSEFVERCPEIVQSFVNSIIEGWELAIRDPKLAIEDLRKYDASIDEAKELESLKRGADYYKGDVDTLKTDADTLNPVKELESLQRGTDYYRGEANKILYASKATWMTMAELLKEVGYIETFDYNATVQNKFISWYHSHVKEE